MRMTCHRVLIEDDAMIRYCALSTQKEWKSSFPPESSGDESYYVKMVKDLISKGDDVFFVMEAKSIGPVGMFRLQQITEPARMEIFKGKKTAHLKLVFIEKFMRGYGGGKALMQAVESKARELQYSLVTLDIIRPGLSAFYKKVHARELGVAVDSHHSGHTHHPIYRFSLWLEPGSESKHVKDEHKSAGKHNPPSRSRSYSFR